MADTTITPASPPTYASSLAVPSVGDQVKAATAPGAVRPGYQKLLNAVNAAQTQQYGTISRIRIISDDGVNISVQPFGGFSVDDAGVATAYKNTGTSFGFNAASKLQPAGPLLANTVYWLYMGYSGGLFFEVREKGVSVADDPDSGLFYATSGTDRLFLGYFITDLTAAIVAYKQYGGTIHFTGRSARGLGVNGNLILNNGNATVRTAVSFSNAAPFHLDVGTLVTFEGQLDTADVTLDYGFVGETGVTPYSCLFQGKNSLIGYGQGRVAGGQLDYSVSAATAFLSLWIVEAQLW